MYINPSQILTIYDNRIATDARLLERDPNQSELLDRRLSRHKEDKYRFVNFMSLADTQPNRQHGYMDASYVLGIYDSRIAADSRFLERHPEQADMLNRRIERHKKDKDKFLSVMALASFQNGRRRYA